MFREPVRRPSGPGTGRFQSLPRRSLGQFKEAIPPAIAAVVVLAAKEGPCLGLPSSKTLIGNSETDDRRHFRADQQAHSIVRLSPQSTKNSKPSTQLRTPYRYWWEVCCCPQLERSCWSRFQTMPDSRLTVIKPPRLERKFKFGKLVKDASLCMANSQIPQR